MIAVRGRYSSKVLSLPASGANEALGVEIRFPSSFSLQIINLYFSPGAADEDWLQQVIDNCRAPYILVGDLNGHYSCWGSLRDSQQGIFVINWSLQNNLCLFKSSAFTPLAQRSRPALLNVSFRLYRLLPLMMSSPSARVLCRHVVAVLP